MNRRSKGPGLKLNGLDSHGDGGHHRQHDGNDKNARPTWATRNAAVVIEVVVAIDSRRIPLESYEPEEEVTKDQDKHPVRFGIQAELHNRMNGWLL